MRAELIGASCSSDTAPGSSRRSSAGPGSRRDRPVAPRKRAVAVGVAAAELVDLRHPRPHPHHPAGDAADRHGRGVRHEVDDVAEVRLGVVLVDRVDPSVGQSCVRGGAHTRVAQSPGAADGLPGRPAPRSVLAAESGARLCSGRGGRIQRRERQEALSPVGSRACGVDLNEGEAPLLRHVRCAAAASDPSGGRGELAAVRACDREPPRGRVEAQLPQGLAKRVEQRPHGSASTSRVGSQRVHPDADRHLRSVSAGATPHG